MIDQETMLGFIRNNFLAYAASQFPEFQPSPLHKLIASKLEDVETGKIRRLAILVPPRHGKSKMTSELFPSWYLGRHPQQRVIGLSYGSDLATVFGRSVRNYCKTPTFATLFPGCQISSDSSSKRAFNTTAGGGYTTLGVGAGVTGRGANILILDDLIKNREEAESQIYKENLVDWYRGAARTRLQPDGAIVLCQTRWGTSDFVSWLLTETEHEGWQVINLPAIALKDDPLGRQPGEALWPEAYPVEALNQIRETLGSRDWTSIYQQSPIADSDVIIRQEWLRFYTQSPFARTIAADLLGMPGTDFEIVASWDLSFGANKQTSSWVVGQVWARNRRNSFCYLLHQYREQIGFVDSIRAITEVNERFRPTVTLIENKALGTGAIEVLREVVPNLKAVEPLGGKEDRLYRVIPKFERGEVWLPDVKTYPWVKPLMTEIESFPMSQSDDCVDCLSQALGYFQQYDVNNWLQIYSMRS